VNTPTQLGVARMQSSTPISSERDVAAEPSAETTISPTSAKTATRTTFKALISIGLTVAVFYLVFSRSDVPSFDVFLAQFSAKLFLIVIVLSVIATALSVWRLKLIAQDLGYRLSIRDSVAALSFGLLAGTMFFQLIGQLMARGALLSRRGMPVAATITLTVYERAAAAGVSLLMAIAGGWYVFGRLTLDIEHGGLVFLKIVAGLMLAMAAGGWLAWGSKALAAGPRKIDRAFLAPIARNVLISIAIQCATMAAYVAAAHTLAPAVPLLDLAAATAVVMLAAALPISLAGWGVRELSAVIALGVVGVPNDAALIVAILIGITSLLVVGAFALSSFWPGAATAHIPANRVDQPIDYGAVLAWAIPILAATAVFFQLYVPVGKGVLNVNLADPLAILGGALFLISAISSRRWPAWRLSWLNTHIFAITVILAVALLHGATVFGWTSWALTNRFVGWFILLGYAAAGALIVHRGGREGLVILLRTFAAVACSIVALDLFLIVLTRFGVELPNAVLFLRMGGFAQNPNAFGFQIMLALCAAITADFRPKIAVLVTTICLVGIWFAASRAVFVAVPFVIGLALYSREMPVRRLVASAIFAACVVVFVAMLPPIVSITVSLPQLVKVISVWIFSETVFAAQFVLNHIIAIPDPLPPAPSMPDLTPLNIASPSLRYDVPGQFVSGSNTESSNVERIASLQGALNIFLGHPIFGGGLGLFVAERLRQFGQTLVIHSTPLWLLAETGIVGFFVVATLFARVLISEFRRLVRGDSIALLIVLILMALGIVSLVHELFYQRGFWFLFGAAMAMLPLTGTRPSTAQAQQ
jgi:hypothetical protein